MESHPEKRPSPEGQNKALTEEVKILRYACSSILNDESFMIPGEASELCVQSVPLSQLYPQVVDLSVQ